jgi:hypothetical protein
MPDNISTQLQYCSVNGVSIIGVADDPWYTITNGNSTRTTRKGMKGDILNIDMSPDPDTVVIRILPSSPSRPYLDSLYNNGKKGLVEAGTLDIRIDDINDGVNKSYVSRTKTFKCSEKSAVENGNDIEYTFTGGYIDEQ